MFEYASGEFGEVEWSDLEDARDSIVENYGDEPHELLLAEADYSDARLVEALTEVIDYNSYGAILVPEDRFEDFIMNKVEDALSEIISQKERGIWPFTLIKFDKDEIVQDALDRLQADTVDLDENYVVFNDTL
jgi:hypothetical protein